VSSVLPPSNDDVGGCADPVFLFLMQYKTVSIVNKTVEMIPNAWGKNNSVILLGSWVYRLVFTRA